jgi:hypothetical protein
LQVIGETAFADAVDLKAIVLPRSVKMLSKDYFSNCLSLEDLTFEGGSELEMVKQGAFTGYGMAEVVIPAFIRAIGAAAFCTCQSLESVTFEAGSCLREVGLDVFQGFPCDDRVNFPRSAVVYIEQVRPSKRTHSSHLQRKSSAIRPRRIPGVLSQWDSRPFTAHENGHCHFLRRMATVWLMRIQWQINKDKSKKPLVECRAISRYIVLRHHNFRGYPQKLPRFRYRMYFTVLTDKILADG